MRKLILALAAVTALAVAGPAGAATKTINIFGSAFSPKSATITQGDTVTWVNKDNANHQVLADKGQFVSPILRHNQSYSFTFNAAGTYTYKDELNPKRLTGTIIVKGLPPTLTLAASSQYVVYGDKVTLRKVLLNSRSSFRVIVKLPKGLNQLRVTMSVNQAGAGFLGAVSSVVKWRQLT